MTDPTKPANILKSVDIGGQQVSKDFKLSQIYISDKKRLATINGQQVKTGDLIEGAKVVVIKSNSVHLLINGSITKISIMPSIKQY